MKRICVDTWKQDSVSQTVSPKKLAEILLDILESKPVVSTVANNSAGISGIGGIIRQ